jgi:hypothetical protein
MLKKRENPPPSRLQPTADFPITGEHRIDLGLRPPTPEGFFIPGPILLSDLIPVGKMSGKTVVVWLLVKYRSGYQKQEWVTLPTYALKEWGISRDAKIDALKRLEQAGVIAVDRPGGGGYLKVKLLGAKKGKGK